MTYKVSLDRKISLFDHYKSSYFTSFGIVSSCNRRTVWCKYFYFSFKYFEKLHINFRMNFKTHFPKLKNETFTYKTETFYFLFFVGGRHTINLFVFRKNAFYLKNTNIFQREKKVGGD